MNASSDSPEALSSADGGQALGGELGISNYTAASVKGEPVEVSEGVFVIPDNRVAYVPNVGIVVGSKAAMVVDTGMGPRNGAFVLEQARHLAGDRPLYLVVTEVDPGHGFGAQAFKAAATIVYSSAQRQRLRNRAPAYVDMFRGLGPAVASELEGLELVDSDITYEGQLEIDLGGTRALLRSWAPAHSGDDQTILIDDRVLFIGDLTETRMFPIVPYFPPFNTHFDGRRWIAALDELIASATEIVVPGHGEVTDIQQVRDVRDYLDYIGTEVGRLRADGMSPDEAGGMIEERAVATWPAWEWPQFIRLAVQAFYENP